MDLGIAGKKAIVGGASTGLGRAVAERLAAEGVDLALCARTESTLKATAAEIAEQH
ncbi:SDR family NAD(P)-dependent oxidoreductase, partial [bacterium]|nr:SDR family NAD(P)-dependent oxidoreductase [bacterium]